MNWKKFSLLVGTWIIGIVAMITRYISIAYIGLIMICAYQNPEVLGGKVPFFKVTPEINPLGQFLLLVLCFWINEIINKKFNLWFNSVSRKNADFLSKETAASS